MLSGEAQAHRGGIDGASHRVSRSYSPFQVWEAWEAFNFGPNPEANIEHVTKLPSGGPDWTEGRRRGFPLTAFDVGVLLPEPTHPATTPEGLLLKRGVAK